MLLGSDSTAPTGPMSWEEINAKFHSIAPELIVEAYSEGYMTLKEAMQRIVSIVKPLPPLQRIILQGELFERIALVEPVVRKGRKHSGSAAKHIALAFASELADLGRNTNEPNAYGGENNAFTDAAKFMKIAGFDISPKTIFNWWYM